MDKLSVTLQEKILNHPTNTVLRNQSKFVEQQFDSIPRAVPIRKWFKVPDHFDGRKVWKGLLSPVMDQGSCGSCWAFASTSTLADRFNIQSMGMMHIQLSPVKLILCDFQGKEFSAIHPETNPGILAQINVANLMSSSCFGNTLYDAWRYLYVFGTNTEKCIPYDKSIGSKSTITQFKKIGKFDSPNRLPLCTVVSGKIGDMCADVNYDEDTGEELGTAARFYRAFHFYALAGTLKDGGNEYNIRHNIFGWGPVSTGMNVYPDFYTFDAKEEIYEWNGIGPLVGGHAIEIVGWGEEYEKKYWLIKNSWGCYSADTEILTKSGWKLFSELLDQENIATLHPKSHELEYNSINKKFVYDYDGILHHYNGRKIDLLVTPNHNMYINRLLSKKWNIVKSENITLKNYRMKKNCTWKGKERKIIIIGKNVIDMDLWLEFLGYYIAKGHSTSSIYRKSSIIRKRETNYTIDIIQVKIQNLTKIETCLKKLPYTFSRNKYTWTTNNKNLWSVLSPLGKAHEKYLPEYVKTVSSRQLKILYSSLMLGDGYRIKGEKSYYTSSKKLADDMQELLLKIGYCGDISVDERVERKNKRGTTRYINYRVNIKEKDFECSVPGETPSEKYYCGKIHCVNVKNHLVYVRRNGKAVWCGNSQWGIDGYFKMVRGTNNCKIEENIITGIPDFFYPLGYRVTTAADFWLENPKAIEERAKISQQLNITGGGIDNNSGYSRRVGITKPWVNLTRPIVLEDLPSWKTFVAGVDATPKHRYKFQQAIRLSQKDIKYGKQSMWLTMIILGILIILVFIVLALMGIKRM